MIIKQKIFHILKAIDDASQLVGPEESIKVDRYDKQNNFFNNIGNTQLDSIFSLLENEKAVRVIQKAEPLHEITAIKSMLLKSRDNFCFLFFKDQNFDSYFKKIKEELSFQNLKPNDDETTIFELSFDEFSGQISINDLQNKRSYFLKKPHYDSDNRIVFEYLYNNSGKIVNIEELNGIVYKETYHYLGTELDKIAAQLGFNRDLKKLFFTTSKKTARLRKKITKKKLNQTKTNLKSILENLNLKTADF